ncbi:MAG: hypothetical protein WBG09_18500 [Candidatus Sulfotelmatobacter sp.]
MGEIDLDNFDENQYFESPGHEGHCANIATALHRLTGWPIYSLRCPGQAHAVVLSPLGYFDGNGPGARERFFERHGEPDELMIKDVTKHWPYTSGDISWSENKRLKIRRELEDYEFRELQAWVARDDESEPPETVSPILDIDGTERAMPLARALLARWFPNFQPIASQMPLFPDLEEDDF